MIVRQHVHKLGQRSGQHCGKPSQVPFAIVCADSGIALEELDGIEGVRERGARHMCDLHLQPQHAHGLQVLDCLAGPRPEYVGFVGLVDVQGLALHVHGLYAVCLERVGVDFAPIDDHAPWLATRTRCGSGSHFA